MDSKNGFDSIAKYYDFLTRLVFGRSIRNAQTNFLDQIPVSAEILVLGGGTGFWLPELLNKRKDVTVLYVDSSVEMISRARKRVQGQNQVNFIVGTEASLESDKSFDVIITFFYLDLFGSGVLKDIVWKLKSRLNPEGCWLASDFVSEKIWHKGMLAIMYSFFRLTTDLEANRLPDWNSALIEVGLIKVGKKMFYGRFIESAFYQIR